MIVHLYYERLTVWLDWTISVLWQSVIQQGLNSLLDRPEHFWRSIFSCCYLCIALWRLSERDVIRYSRSWGLEVHGGKLVAWPLFKSKRYIWLGGHWISLQEGWWGISRFSGDQPEADWNPVGDQAALDHWVQPGRRPRYENSNQVNVRTPSIRRRRHWVNGNWWWCSLVLSTSSSFVVVVREGHDFRPVSTSCELRR